MKNLSTLLVAIMGMLAVTPIHVSAQSFRPACANNGGGGPGGCGCPPPPNCNSGGGGAAPAAQGGANPFRTYGGNLFREVTDLQVFGGVGRHQLEFTRYYNSRLAEAHSGFGGGAAWGRQYRWIMDAAGNNNATGNPLLSVTTPTGENYIYERVAPHEWRTIYGVGSWIEQSEGTNYVLRQDTGWAYEFVKRANGNYRLTGFVDPEQLRYALKYDADNYLTRITEPGGRYLALTWTNQGGSGKVIGKVATSDGRFVNYTYTNLPAPSGPDYLTLAGATYSDGAQATYRYLQMTNGDPRPLLAEAVDPRYAGTATHMKYEYWEMTNGVGGQVFRELNGSTGEEIARFATYSTNHYDVDAVTNAVIYANGGKQDFVFRGRSSTSDYGDKLIRKVDALGNTTLFGYGDNGKGFLIAETNALGQVTRYGRDTLGRVTSRTNADDSVAFWTYDAVGNELTHTDELGRVTTTTRDSSGRVTQLSYPDGSTEGYSYNSLNQPLTHTNRNGGIETMTYATNGLLLARTDALGGVTGYGYNAAGQPVAVTNALGQVTRMAYNDRGQMIALTNADGSVVSYAYDAFGNRTAMTNELGKVTRWTYDEFKRPTSMTDPLNRTTLYSYDFILPGGGGGCGCANTANKPSLVTSPGGIDTAYIYDEEWRTVGVIHGYGTAEAAETQTEYDALGNVVKTISPTGQTNSFTYDKRNRRIIAKDPLGRITRWTNDVAGQVTAMVAPDNTVTYYGYDAMGRRIAETNALGQVTRYAYDASGNLTTLTDASGNVTTWNYDLLNRQIVKTYADVTQDKFGYDAVGNLKAQTNAMNEVCLHAYDRRNRLTNSVWTGGGAPTVSRSYDALGRLLTINNQLSTLSYSYDSANQLLAETNTIGSITRVVSYGYDLDGRRTKLVYPSGNTLTNTYTARGQLKEIFANGPPPIATFTYDLAGRRTQRTLANGVTTAYDYDMAGQLTNLVHATGSGTVASFAYRYNRVGSRTNAVREDTRSEAYGYDAIQQVTTADYGDSTTEGFNYDTMGNLRSRTGVAPVSNFVTNNLNQYTAIDGTPQTFDLKGNLLIGGTSVTSLMTNSYDAQNRLVAVARGTNTAIFVYDGQNRCIQRTLNGVTTDFVFDGWNLIAEYTGGSIAEYIYGPMVDEMLVRADATNTVYYSGDAMNSTAALTDGSGAVVERYRYTAFGQPTIFDPLSTILVSSAFGNRMLFQGREFFSELNLTDHRNRYYSPELQRWLNRDPIGERGGLNLYNFALNNLVNRLDPLGLLSYCECLKQDLLKLLRNYTRDAGILSDMYSDKDSVLVQQFYGVQAINAAFALAGGNMLSALSAAGYTGPLVLALQAIIQAGGITGSASYSFSFDDLVDAMDDAISAMEAIVTNTKVEIANKKLEMRIRGCNKK